MAEFQLNSKLFQVAFEHLKLKQGMDLAKDEVYASYSVGFKNFISSVFDYAFQERPYWELMEFITLCALFEFEVEIDKVYEQIQKLREKILVTVNHEGDAKNISRSFYNDVRTIKTNIHRIFFRKKMPLLLLLLKTEGLREPITLLEWLKLTEKTIPRQAGFYEAKIKVSENSFLIHPKFRSRILLHYYKIDIGKAKMGISPIEIYSLQEATEYLCLNEDNFLTRCFMEKIGVYCKTSKYRVGSYYYRYPINYEEFDLSYVYLHVGLERLHAKKSIFGDSNKFGDSPTKTLCCSEAIRIKPNDSCLVVPLQPSLSDLYKGITAKSIFLRQEQKISRSDIYFLKSDIEKLKDKYHSNNSQIFELNSSIIKDIELAAKSREKNKKSIQNASKAKKLKAKERWDEPLNCALSIARENPGRYSAADLARFVAKKKKESLPGGVETLRKKIPQIKSIKKYLKQMKETEQK